MADLLKTEIYITLHVDIRNNPEILCTLHPDFANRSDFKSSKTTNRIALKVQKPVRKKCDQEMPNQECHSLSNL